MKIIPRTKPSSATLPLVFFLSQKNAIRRIPLFGFLNPMEREYLEQIKEQADVKEKEAKVFVTPGNARKIIVVGTGKVSAGIMTGIAMRIAVQTAKREKINSFGFWAGIPKKRNGTKKFYEAVAAHAAMANFEFVKYKTPPPEGFPFVEEIEAITGKPSKEIAEGLRRGLIIGEEINACRELANTPGGDMTPRALATHAVAGSEELGIRTTILDEKKIKELGMGGILGVSKGSVEPPRFIIQEYMRGPKTKKPIVLVGKGVTFDTGGLNLKPSSAIYEMHMDMSGGAAVIHAIRAAARLKVKKNIVGLVPAVENMPSGSSYRPGDLLRTLSGKTIEVLDTDAEGRVILADALSYAKTFDPSVVIDVATLTGAAMAALGQRYSALFSNEKKLGARLCAIGEETGDRAWPMPLSADYEEEIKGTFGDLANVGKTRYGGAITGAVFLWQFIKDDSPDSTQNKSGKPAKTIPWAHLDIAPRMTTIEGEYLAKGAAGAPVMLLTRFLEEYSS